jgi:hypothetical protein
MQSLHKAWAGLPDAFLIKRKQGPIQCLIYFKHACHWHCDLLSSSSWRPGMFHADFSGVHTIKRVFPGLMACVHFEVGSVRSGSLHFPGWCSIHINIISWSLLPVLGHPTHWSCFQESGSQLDVLTIDCTNHLFSCFQELGALLGVSSDKAESIAADMILDGRLPGTIDQVLTLTLTLLFLPWALRQTMVQCLCVLTLALFIYGYECHTADEWRSTRHWC